MVHPLLKPEPLSCSAFRHGSSPSMSINNDKEGWEAWLEYEHLRSLLVGPLDMSSDKYRKELASDKEYNRQVYESDGFYVDPSKTSAGIKPCYFNNEDENDLCIQHAKFAIDTFNHRRLSFQDTHRELKFVTLLNATGHSVSGTMYYLTFEAVNLGNGNTYKYQAIVHDSVSCLPNIVKAFRLKPAPGSTKTWFWEDHCCDDEETVSESGEGVSGDSEVIKVTAMFVINADVGYEIIDACLTRHIRVFTGADYSLEETISYPGKKVIVLEGTPEQVQEASPMVLECIRKFQYYEVTGNETLH